MCILPSPRHHFLYFILCAFGLLLTLFGFGLGVGGISTHYWPVTQGTVIDSSVIKKRAGKSGTAYSPTIHYDYTVNSQPYSGFLIKLGDLSFRSKSEAENYLKQLLTSKQLSVYYFPIFPKISVLDRGLTPSSWIVFLVGLFFYCIFYILSAFQARKGRQGS